MSGDPEAEPVLSEETIAMIGRCMTRSDPSITLPSSPENTQAAEKIEQSKTSVPEEPMGEGCQPEPVPEEQSERA